MLLEQVATRLNTTPERLEHDSLRVYLGAQAARHGKRAIPAGSPVWCPDDQRARCCRPSRYGSTSRTSFEDYFRFDYLESERGVLARAVEPAVTVTLDDLRQVAEIEFGDLVTDSLPLGEKLRLYLSDGTLHRPLVVSPLARAIRFPLGTSAPGWHGLPLRQLPQYGLARRHQLSSPFPCWRTRHGDFNALRN